MVRRLRSATVRNAAGGRALLDRFREALVRLRGGGAGALLARGASAFLLIQVAGIAATFGLHVLLARTLGVDDYGVWVYVYGWAALLIMLSRVGFGTSALRHVAAYAGTGDWGRLRGFLRFQNRVVLFVALAVSAATAAVVAWTHPEPTLLRTFTVACVVFPLSALAQVWGSTLRGLRHVVLSQAPTGLLQPVLTALVVIVGVGLGLSPTAPGAMAAVALAAFVALAVTGIAIRRVLPAQIRNAAPEVEARTWLRVAAPLMAINLMSMALQRADILVIGSVVGPAEAGLYAPARRLALMIGLGLVGINSWAAPLIADLHARGERQQLRHLTRRAAQLVFAFTAPITVGVLVLGRPILGIFGPEFVDGYGALAILAVGQLANALAGPVGLLMTMTGHQNAAARILAVSAAVNLVLLLVLTPRFGIEGAAVASAISTTLWNGAMLVAVWRRLGVRATIL